MNNYFYRPYDEYDNVIMVDPRGYTSPYLDAYLEGEIEHNVLMTKYMNLKNESNYLFKVRCNDQIHGRF